MRLGERKCVQRRQASRAPSVFDAQISSDASQELGGSPLHRQRTAQKEQIPGLHRFNIGAERSWGMREVYAKVLQPSLGAGVCCIRGHYLFSMDITGGHHRPRCAPPSTGSTSPVTWLASVRQNTASATSFAPEICPK